VRRQKEKRVDGVDLSEDSQDYSEGSIRMGRESGNLYRTAGASEKELRRKVNDVIRFLEDGP